MITFSLKPMVDLPQSRPSGIIVPAPSLKHRQPVLEKGMNLHKLCTSWNTLKTTDSNHLEQSQATSVPSPGSPRLEDLPFDVLDQVFDLLERTPAHHTLGTRNADLVSLLLASRSIHATTLNTLYRRIVIPHSRMFRKFLGAILAYPSLASLVRRLDFSHFNPSIYYSTAAERSKASSPSTATLSQCLELTPFLQEFLAQEYIEDDLSAGILRKLFLGMSWIQALDFCGCSSARFRHGFEEIIAEPWPEMLNITRLSFHKCINLPPTVFETVLPCLHRLTHLDVAGTRITDKALASIPWTARITHLNLAKCRELSFKATVDFLATCPVVNQSVVVLSVSNDATGHLHMSKVGVGELLRSLPLTLRSLSLKGCHMNALHVPLLAKFSQSLEELAVGRGLSQSDIRQMLTHRGRWHRHSLRYLDVSDTDLVIDGASPLLAPDTAPLSIIELEEGTYERAAKNKKNLERLGWEAQEFGRRYRLARVDAGGDSGERRWKMGAGDWGARKIPVAAAEVSGIYASFMFGRQ